MALRNIRTDNDPILRKTSRKVEFFDDKLVDLANDMIETMYENDGVGLAAVQVGILKRIVVIDVYDGNGARVFVNPEIIFEDGYQCDMEGCLSLPGKAEEVARPNIVRVKAQDLNGELFELEGVELMARALCHELDHLDGVLFVDRAEKK